MITSLVSHSFFLVQILLLIIITLMSPFHYLSGFPLKDKFRVRIWLYITWKIQSYKNYQECLQNCSICDRNQGHSCFIISPSRGSSHFEVKNKVKKSQQNSPSIFPITKLYFHYNNYIPPLFLLHITFREILCY